MEQNLEKQISAIRRQLLKDLKSNGTKNAVTCDLVEKYIQAWLNEDTPTMAAILNALQVSPKTARRKKLEEEIRDQLAIKEMKGEIWEDRIEIFLKIWDAFQEAHRFLNEKGRVYMTISASGKEYEKDNAAAKDLVTYEKSMRDMLDSFDINISGYADPDSAGDDGW